MRMRCPGCGANLFHVEEDDDGKQYPNNRQHFDFPHSARIVLPRVYGSLLKFAVHPTLYELQNILILVS